MNSKTIILLGSPNVGKTTVLTDGLDNKLTANGYIKPNGCTAIDCKMAGNRISSVKNKDNFYCYEKNDKLVIVTSAGDTLGCIRDAEKYISFVLKKVNKAKVIWVIAVSCQNDQTNRSIYETYGISMPKEKVNQEVEHYSKNKLKTSSIFPVLLIGNNNEKKAPKKVNQNYQNQALENIFDELDRF